jgi:hypothetical protein
LTAPRFDAAKWANQRDDESLGFVIDDADVWPASTPEDGPTRGGPEKVAEFFDEIVTNIASLREVKTDIISPLQGNNIFITGNVEISGDATISGTLTADKIKSTTIDTLRDRIETLADSYQTATATAAAEVDPEFQAWLDAFEANPATTSGEFADISHIDAASGFFSEYLAVLGQTVLTDLQVTGTVTLTSLTSPTGTIDLAGNLVIDGDLTVKGNVVLLGDLTAPTASFSSLIAKNLEADTAKINELTTNQLIIAADASASAQVASNSASIATNATAGRGVLPAGVTEYTIYTPRVDADSLVYVTPIGDPQNQVLYVKAKQENEWFKVAINQPLAIDLPFNWWIIKLE